MAGGYKGIGSRCLSGVEGKSFYLVSLSRVFLCPLFLSTDVLPRFFLVLRTPLAFSFFPARYLCTIVLPLSRLPPFPCLFLPFLLPFSGPTVGHLFPPSPLLVLRQPTPLLLRSPSNVISLRNGN